MQPKSYTITFVAVHSDQPLSDVLCGDCTKCCSLSPLLTPEEFESGQYIYTFVDAGNGNPTVAIPNTEKGCIYFDQKCTIYDRRPRSCRVFDCRKGHYPAFKQLALDKFGEYDET